MSPLIESDHALRYVVDVNEWLPVHPGASGLVILASLPVPDQELVLRGRAAFLPRSVAQPLSEVLAEVRDRGYAVTEGYHVTGAAGVAAPIYNAEGRIAGSLGITMPEARFQPRQGPKLGQLLKQAADQVSGLLAARQDPDHGDRS